MINGVELSQIRAIFCHFDFLDNLDLFRQFRQPSVKTVRNLCAFNNYNRNQIINKQRKEALDRLKQYMGNKRAATDSNRKTKCSSALHEITVQRLASELDNKQTFKPVQSREFVELPHKYLTLWHI